MAVVFTLYGSQRKSPERSTIYAGHTNWSARSRRWKSQSGKGGRVVKQGAKRRQHETARDSAGYEEQIASEGTRLKM